jgi:hypothetical protein
MKHRAGDAQEKKYNKWKKPPKNHEMEHRGDQSRNIRSNKHHGVVAAARFQLTLDGVPEIGGRRNSKKTIKRKKTKKTIQPVILERELVSDKFLVHEAH